MKALIFGAFGFIACAVSSFGAAGETVSFEVTREFKCDVLVVGGGPSGFSAAVCSARHGAKTILAERNGYLGGLKLNPFTVGAEAFDPNGGHIQGIAATKDALYASQMTRLVKLDWTGKVLAKCDVPNHTGDIVFHDGQIYTALAVLPGNTEGSIQVYDKDLNFVRQNTIDRAIDGITFADGVLYVGMGAKEQPSANPHRVNILGRFDAKTLEEIAPRTEFDYGFDTRYGFQDIVFDGKNLLAAFYAVDGAPCVVAFDKDLNIKGTASVVCSQGFDMLPPTMWENGRRFVRATTVVGESPACISCTFDFIELEMGK